MLFGTQRQAITKHLKNFFESGELERQATCFILELFQKEGNRMVRRNVEQYTPIDIIAFGRSHDRFLCIDETVYHLGASIKDLGKKWFAFNRMEMQTSELLQKMQ